MKPLPKSRTLPVRLNRHRSRKTRGATMPEIVIGASLTTMVMGSLILAMVSGMGSWAKGQGKITSNMEVQSAMRVVTQELREAMFAEIEGSGMRINYRLPKRTDGKYDMPIEWDGINRSIYRTESGNLILLTGDATRVIAKNVKTVDPWSPNGTRAYKIFVPGSGTVLRKLDVLLAVENYGKGGKKEWGRVRESVQLRNVPILTQ